MAKHHMGTSNMLIVNHLWLYWIVGKRVKKS